MFVRVCAHRYLRENKGMDESLLQEAIEKFKREEIAEAIILHSAKEERQSETVAMASLG